MSVSSPLFPLLLKRLSSFKRCFRLLNKLSLHILRHTWILCNLHLTNGYSAAVNIQLPASREPSNLRLGRNFDKLWLGITGNGFRNTNQARSSGEAIQLFQQLLPVPKQASTSHSSPTLWILCNLPLAEVYLLPWTFNYPLPAAFHRSICNNTSRSLWLRKTRNRVHETNQVQSST